MFSEDERLFSNVQAPVSLDERVAYMRELEESAAANLRRVFEERHLVSWVYHDSALEGVVYTMEELRAGSSDNPPQDTSLLSTYDEIRNHRAAIALIRDYADKKRQPINLDVVKKIFLTLAPDETEGKGVPKYRKDMPVHRLYFHDIATPDKIQPKLKQLLDWMNAAETKRSTHTIRLAAKTHYQFLHAYPFAKHSGKVARLLMNLILMRAGYPPVIVHATERQRYYEALKASENHVATLVNEALVASVESAIRYFEESQGIV